MRTLLIAILLANLIGCCPMPPQAMTKPCSSKDCFHRTAAGPPTELRPASFKPNAAATKVKVTKTAETPRPSAAESGDRVGLVEKETIPPTTLTPEVSAPVQPSETSDAILKKAKTTVAAQMEYPASAEFGDMKRAIRKDAFGQPADTICGHVKGKRASGEQTEERLFLYLLKEDKAYLDDGYPESVAATTYRTICTSPALH